MKTGSLEALLLTLAMGAVIFFCRVFPFLFFRGETPLRETGEERTGDADGESGSGKNNRGKSGMAAFLDFVETTVPPLAITVLAFNALASTVYANLRGGIPVLAAAAFTALVHLWRRNPLISIFGGTALYMALERVMGIV